jgi:hypothetical protein
MSALSRGSAALAILATVCLALPVTSDAQCSFTVRGRTMFLDGDCDTEETIYVPDKFTLIGQGHTITAIETSAGAWVGAIVQNEGGTANVKNLNLTTSGLDCACKSGLDRLAGIRLVEASGKISGNAMFGIRKGNSCGCQEGIGIEVRNPPLDGGGGPGSTRADITNNLVALYQKGGIAILGNVDAKISKNSTLGLQPVSFIAQNGIQVSYGASGVVQDNFCDGNYYTGANWASTGILIFESDSVKVHANTVIENQIGVGIEAWHWQAPSADRTTVSANEITGAEWGVTVAAYNLAGYSAGSATANRNKISANTITTSEGEAGIYVGAAEYWCPCDPYFPEADSNELANNVIVGFDEEIVDEGTNTEIKSAGGKGKGLPVADPYLPE